MKIRSVGAELFPADRRTDMTKVIVAFRNFANAPKNSTSTLTQLRSGRRTELGSIPGRGKDTVLFIDCNSHIQYRMAKLTANRHLAFKVLRISGATPPQEYQRL